MMISPPKTDEEAFKRLIGKGRGGYGYSRSQIAAMCGVTKQALTRWKVIPSHHVIKISDATGISRAELKPSLYM